MRGMDRAVRKGPPIPLELEALDAAGCGRCGAQLDKAGLCSARCEQARVTRMDDAPTGAE